MRISISWIILLGLLAIVLPGWLGMRGIDFLTPPGDAELDALRTRTKSALPRMATRADAISPKGEGTRAIAAAPPIQLGKLSAPPKIDEYADRAPRGAPHLIEIANRLGDEGHPHRALLAWERVIDSASASSTEVEAAVKAVARLRPTLPPWNRDVDAALPIILQVGTGQKSAETLEPVLNQVAADVARASSGILTITTRINAGPDIDLADAPVPVALWITGPDGTDHSTDVRSFTVATPETLEYDVHRTIYQLLQGYFGKSSAIRKPSKLPDDGDPRTALDTRLTRLHWQTFGESLNQIAESPE